MIYAGLDTSGDHDPSTPYVISVVVSEDSKSIRDSVLGRVVEEVRKALGKKDYIIHATNDSEGVRRVVVSVLEKYCVKAKVLVILDRSKVNRKYLAGVIKGLDISSAFVVYDNPIFDGIIKHVARKAVKVSLSDELSAPLQVADYFSYFWWELFSGKLSDFFSFEKILSLTSEVRVIGFQKKLSLCLCKFN